VEQDRVILRGPPPGARTAGVRVLTFAGGSFDVQGRFAGPCAFEGAWLGEGTASRRLRGATPDGVLALAQPADRRALERDYGGKVVSVWEYAPGDHVEAALIEG
jgi:hypothetical protein